MKKGKNLGFSFLSLALLICLSSVYAQGTTDSVDWVMSTAPSEVEIGQDFELSFTSTTYSLQTKNLGGNIVVPALSDFNILKGPITQKNASLSFVKGKKTEKYTTTYRFVLAPLKEGDFSIDPFTFKIGERELKTDNISIKVLEETEVNIEKDSDFTLVASLSSDAPFVGQRLWLVYTLYMQKGIEIRQFSITEEDAYSDFTHQAEELVKPEKAIVTKMINGRSYTIVLLKKVAIISQSTGEYTISPLSAEIKYNRGTGTQSISIFDQPKTQSINLKSNPIRLYVK